MVFKKKITYIFFYIFLMILFLLLTIEIFMFVTTASYFLKLNYLFDKDFKFIINFNGLMEEKFLLLILLIFIISIFINSFIIYKISFRLINKILIKIFLYCILAYPLLLIGLWYFLYVIIKGLRLKKKLSHLEFNSIFLNLTFSFIFSILLMLIGIYISFVIYNFFLEFEKIEKKELHFWYINCKDNKKTIKIIFFISNIPFYFLGINLAIFTYFILNHNLNYFWDLDYFLDLFLDLF